MHYNKTEIKNGGFNMTAIVNPVRPLNPPYYHREYSNDIDRPNEEPSKYKSSSCCLTFCLYKPLTLPISLGMGVIRFYTAGDAIQSKDWKKLSLGSCRQPLLLLP